MIHLPFLHASLLSSHLEGEGEREGKKEEGEKGRKKGREKGRGRKKKGEWELRGKGTFFDRREKGSSLGPRPKTNPSMDCLQYWKRFTCQMGSGDETKKDQAGTERNSHHCKYRERWEYAEFPFRGAYHRPKDHGRRHHPWPLAPRGHV